MMVSLRIYIYNVSIALSRSNAIIVSIYSFNISKCRRSDLLTALAYSTKIADNDTEYIIVPKLSIFITKVCFLYQIVCYQNIVSIHLDSNL